MIQKNQPATKEDVKNLRKEATLNTNLIITELSKDIRNAIQESEQRMKSEMKDMRHDLSLRIVRTEERLDNHETRLAHLESRPA